jgi:polysaccharide export outer membrane protein
MSNALTARRLAGCVMAVAVLALAACTGAKYPPAPFSADTAADKDYIIGPGDQLNIVVWRNPEVSQVVPVRPDGKITTPLVEDVVAIGKTPTQLARDLEKALAKYIQDPVVSVVVMGFVGPYSEQVRVVGQAAKPQALAYRKNMTLLDVMIAVGGITEFADGNRATLIRGADKKQYGVRLNDLLNRGDVSANVEVRPGDVVVIPESIF